MSWARSRFQKKASFHSMGSAASNQPQSKKRRNSPTATDLEKRKPSAVESVLPASVISKTGRIPGRFLLSSFTRLSIACQIVAGSGPGKSVSVGADLSPEEGVQQLFER